MRCKKCGFEMGPGDLFCQECGTRAPEENYVVPINPIVEEPVEAPEAEAAPEAPVAEAPIEVPVVPLETPIEVPEASAAEAPAEELPVEETLTEEPTPVFGEAIAEETPVVDEAAGTIPVAPVPTPTPASNPAFNGIPAQPYVAPNPAYSNANPVPAGMDPNLDYTPIGMWGYFGYEILFLIPCIGFIFLVVFALGGTKNVNLRNFARSYFCLLIITFVIGIIIMLVTGAGLMAGF